MNFILFIFAVTIFSFTVLSGERSLAQGFSTGNEFKATLISGRLTLICPANAPENPVQQISSFNCRAGMLEPVEYDYFLGPKVDGDSVVLDVTREDGSVRSKTSGYDGLKGKSQSRFNLWISTLTQRPLLADGVNKVAYKISKAGTSVTKGDFTAKVVRQPTAYCRDRTMHAQLPQDCQNQMTACGKYFELENYCQ